MPHATLALPLVTNDRNLTAKEYTVFSKGFLSYYSDFNESIDGCPTEYLTYLF
jgi:hypothetical protein